MLQRTALPSGGSREGTKRGRRGGEGPPVLCSCSGPEQRRRGGEVLVGLMGSERDQLCSTGALRGDGEGRLRANPEHNPF